MDATSLPRERVDATPGDPTASWPGAAVSGRERLLAPPRWLRDLGTSAWLITGIALVTLAAISLMALTQTIVMPVITAGVIAAVASPIVGWLQRHGVARLLGAVIVLVGFLVAAALLVVMVVGGVLSQGDDVSKALTTGLDKAGQWLHDSGASAAEVGSAKDTVREAAKDVVPALLNGVTHGIGALSSLVFFLSLTALSLVFLLKDGPSIRAWAEGHAAMPVPLARTISGRLLQSMRGYFIGMTAVAVFNAVVVGLGALIIGVPLAGTIAIVTFVGAYIPYLGAWTAGIFTIVLALGSGGPEAAIPMAIVCLLANGVLQQLVQPIAYGAALGIHPLAVLIVTIAGGSLFGAVGLILAAPLTSALTRIAGDLSAMRQPADVEQPAGTAADAGTGAGAEAVPA